MYFKTYPSVSLEYKNKGQVILILERNLIYLYLFISSPDFMNFLTLP